MIRPIAQASLAVDVMRSWMLHILSCPFCGQAPLSLASRDERQDHLLPPPPFDEEPCHRHGRAPCRECRDTLIRQGELECLCGQVFPIRDFVPRFATCVVDATKRRTAACYSYLWHRIPVGRVFGRTVDEEVRSFAIKTGVDVSRLRGRLVLDAGSGACSTIKQLGTRGAHAVGADIVVPDDAIRADRAREYEFVQCDITAPPFRPCTFDVVYSVGVIHHLIDWREAMRNLARLTRRPEGQLSVWVYDRDRARFIRLDDAVRWFTSRLPNPLMHWLAKVIAPALPTIRRLQGARPRPIARKDRVHIVFDWLKTPHRSFHREHDLRDILEQDEWALAYRSPHSLGLAFRDATAFPSGEVPTWSSLA